MAQTKYTANGKLLISGEYLVMKGAKAFALPTKLGQQMTVDLAPGKQGLFWRSGDPSGVWFEASFDIPGLNVRSSNNPEIAKTLQNLLATAIQLNPDFRFPNETVFVQTRLGFDRFWGLGSSSSLVYLISQWIGCDPFALNRIIFQGSGYDIACAMSNEPLIYRLLDKSPQWSAVPFNPPFSNHLWLVYLNRKQNSLSELRLIQAEFDYSSEIARLDEITSQIIHSGCINRFITLIDQHEAIIGSVIRRQPVKQSLFGDFNGTVKSLGAWGGDFVLVASLWPEDKTEEYFIQKGYNSIFKLNHFIRP